MFYVLAYNIFFTWNVKHIKGELDGIKYLFNKEYKQLPVVKKENY